MPSTALIPRPVWPAYLTATAAGVLMLGFGRSAMAEDKDLTRSCRTFSSDAPVLVANDGSRQALVIGNSRYEHVQSLRYPPTDAERVAEALWQTGFEVRICHDLTLARFEDAVTEFHGRRAQAQLSVFYYSGHGGELWDENFLYPTDVSQPEQGWSNLEQVRKVALSVGWLLDQNKANARRMDVIILDACRVSPFARGEAGGLGELDATEGLVVVYSTQAHKVANDSSVFSTALSRSWVEPGIGLLDVLNNAKNAAYAEMSGNQQPLLSVGPGVSNLMVIPSAAGQGVVPPPIPVDRDTVVDLPPRTPKPKTSVALWTGVGAGALALGAGGLWTAALLSRAEVLEQGEDIAANDRSEPTLVAYTANMNRTNGLGYAAQGVSALALGAGVVTVVLRW